MKKSGQIILLWLVWAILLMGFQQLVGNRFQPKRPDGALSWTLGETGRTSQKDQKYLNEPFMNEAVAWDSEYYLSIAMGGYDDPDSRWAELDGDEYALNYAFFPVYPMLMRLTAVPLQQLGLDALPTAVLSGIIISLLGTLLGMFALYDLARDELGHDGAMRALFYLLIFPTGFFLAQVYTEGLFVGLAFGALAVMRRGRGRWTFLLAAAILSALATMTRAVGIALAPLLFLSMFDLSWEGWRLKIEPFRSRAWLFGGLAALLPTAVFLIWNFSMWGSNFHSIEAFYFGRGAMKILPSIGNWREAWLAMNGSESYLVGVGQQTAVYFALEFAAMLLGLVAIIFTIKRYTAVALFSLAAWVAVVFSGSPQSMIRYMLVLPAIYIFLARIGKYYIIDRAWTIASLLLFSLLTILYTFDFWVA